MESTGIKFPDMKGSGVSVRSQRMKMPANVGQKKIKGVEQLLQELGVGESRSYTYMIEIIISELY